MARILIVDDEPDTVAVFSLAVELLGHEPIAAGSGQESLELIVQQSPDLVLLDYMMPRMNGIETLRRIRNLPQGEPLPVVMVTASSDETLDEQILFAGGNGCVRKPMGLETLVALIEEHVSDSRVVVHSRKYAT